MDVNWILINFLLGFVIYKHSRNITPVKKEVMAAQGQQQLDSLQVEHGSNCGEQMERPVSAFRSILPQILAVNVKNVLLFGYGMTLGFPTILIPAILGGEGRESTMDNKLHLSKEEISWLSTYTTTSSTVCLLKTIARLLGLSRHVNSKSRVA